MLKKLSFSFISCAIVFAVLCGGCAFNSYLKGVDKSGAKIYLGPLPIEKSEAFVTYSHSQKTEVNKQQYLFARLKEAPKNLQYFHDGNWYGWLEAYRGGMWLMRNRYQKGQDTRTFLKKYVWRSEFTNNLHLVKYPDGSIQIAYDILINELDLLEKTTGQ